MSRGDGFTTADVDTGYFEDAKLRDLWQRLLDPDKMARAVCLHKATVLASWRQGCRVTVTQGAPLWLVADDELVSALRASKMLDRSGRVPQASWDQWYGPAAARREARREAGRIGGRASGSGRSTIAERSPKQPLTVAEPVRTVPLPSGPAVPEDARPPETDKEPDPADAYWTLTGKYPTSKPLAWIDDLTRTYGAMAVIRAVAEAHQADPATASLLGRAQDRLRRDARTLDLRAQAVAQTQIQARRASPRPVVDEAERQRVLRELMGGTA